MVVKGIVSILKSDMLRLETFVIEPNLFTYEPDVGKTFVYVFSVPTVFVDSLTKPFAELFAMFHSICVQVLLVDGVVYIGVLLIWNEKLLATFLMLRLLYLVSVYVYNLLISSVDKILLYILKSSIKEPLTK